LRFIHRLVAFLDVKERNKLGPTFYGPFHALEHVNTMAYKLEFPPGAKLHNVFHVGLLKPFQGTPPDGPGVLPPTRLDRACPQPAEVIKGRLARGMQELLVHWEPDASWVELKSFEFPPFQLEDELIVQGGGGDVMTDIHYQRRKKKQSPAT
jgi:hypothetical protein